MMPANPATLVVAGSLCMMLEAMTLTGQSWVIICHSSCRSQGADQQGQSVADG